MIRYLLVVQVPDASDKREWPLFGALDRLVLRFETREHVIRMILHHVIFDMASLGAAFGARFDVDVCHCATSLVCLVSANAAAFSRSQ